MAVVENGISYALGGAAGGATLGAVIGTIGGPPGVAIGAAIGAAAGGLGGAFKAIYDDAVGENSAPSQSGGGALNAIPTTRDGVSNWQAPARILQPSDPGPLGNALTSIDGLKGHRNDIPTTGPNAQVDAAAANLRASGVTATPSTEPEENACGGNALTRLIRRKITDPGCDIPTTR